LAKVDYIDAEDVRRTPFRVAVSPLPSLHAALVEAAGGRAKGAPHAWTEAIRRQLKSQDYATLAPFTTPVAELLPDPLVGLATTPGESFKDGIERMMATDEEALIAEIEGCIVANGNVAWREALRDLPRWLRSYVAALLRAWKAFGPLWEHARPALGREIERIGASTALDAQLELLDGLTVDGTVRDGRWYSPCPLHGRRLRFPDNGLVLMPLLGGDRSRFLDVRGDILGTIVYPLRRVGRLAAAASPEDALEALLGAPRAVVLRALGWPTSIGRLAETLRTVPSAATHHVGALESAGLVTRNRSGRHVLVRRTWRGEALLALYAELDAPFLGSSRRSSRGTGTPASRPAT
jgi:DNA-binding MarR family transcriptional regulator